MRFTVHDGPRDIIVHLSDIARGRRASRYPVADR
jgi:hypothetical protein